MLGKAQAELSYWSVWRSEDNLKVSVHPSRGSQGSNSGQLVSWRFYPLSHPPPYSAVLNQCLWVEEMAQRVNDLPCKPSDLSSISDLHRVAERVNSTTLSSDLHMLWPA